MTRLRIPFIPNYKHLLKLYAEKIAENEDLVKIVIEKDKWKQSFWDLMYKRYNNLSASLPLSKEEINNFEHWFLGQLRISLDILSIKNTIKIQREYLSSLKTESKQLEQHLLRVSSKRDILMRRLRVAKDPINKDMKEANDLLDTPKGPQLRLLTGGKDGPPTSSNWLLELPEGSVFGCKRKGDLEFVAYQFTIDWKGERMVLLHSEIPQRLELPVDSMGFSMSHELIEIQRKGFPSVD